MSAPPEAAKPVWCNLSVYTFRTSRTPTLSQALVHGLPRVGDHIEVGECDGEVTEVRWAPTPDGSYKPTVYVRVTP